MNETYQMAFFDELSKIAGIISKAVKSKPLTRPLPVYSVDTKKKKLLTRLKDRLTGGKFPEGG